jgi:hypothetical protein
MRITGALLDTDGKVILRVANGEVWMLEHDGDGLLVQAYVPSGDGYDVANKPDDGGKVHWLP